MLEWDLEKARPSSHYTMMSRTRSHQVIFSGLWASSIGRDPDVKPKDGPSFHSVHIEGPPPCIFPPNLHCHSHMLEHKTAGVCSFQEGREHYTIASTRSKHQSNLFLHPKCGRITFLLFASGNRMSWDGFAGTQLFTRLNNASYLIHSNNNAIWDVSS